MESSSVIDTEGLSNSATQTDLYSKKGRSPKAALNSHYEMSSHAGFTPACACLEQLLYEEKYSLMHRLISSRRIMRAAGHCFKPISAYGYLFWANYTKMSRIFEKYIDILEKKPSDQNIGIGGM